MKSIKYSKIYPECTIIPLRYSKFYKDTRTSAGVLVGGDNSVIARIGVTIYLQDL